MHAHLGSQTYMILLQERRQFLDMTFFYKCIFSFYNCPEILENICFHVPSRSLRSLQHFKPTVSKINVHTFAFMQRSMKFLNTILMDQSCDIFNCSYGTFRRFLISMIYSS